jgi:hypothetical protein
MRAATGGKEGVPFTPVSGITANDEFFKIKNGTRGDLLATSHPAAVHGDRAEHYPRV